MKSLSYIRSVLHSFEVCPVFLGCAGRLELRLRQRAAEQNKFDARFNNTSGARVSG